MAPKGAANWQEKQREYEQKKARAKALKLRLTCTICGATPRTLLNCPCGTTQYCSTECQRIDWRDRGHRKACKKIRAERAAEAVRAEAPPPPPEEVFYGPAPRSHADEVRARIAAEHEAARARREANPEPEPESARFGSRCPICLEDWDVNASRVLVLCCCRTICNSCEKKVNNKGECPLCLTPLPSVAEAMAQRRCHVENEVPEAITDLAECYLYGRYGLVKSAKKAAKLYKRAVELGDVQAMNKLGLCYEHGDGVKRDMKKAMQLYRMAASRNSAKGQKNLAFTYFQDNKFDEGIPFLKMSAEAGFFQAMTAMAGLYEDGDGVERDIEEAKRWHARAVAKGHEPSIQELARLNSR